MHSIEHLSTQIRQRGGKVTSQRLMIWRALEQDRTHPTADELYARLKPLLPRLSLSTLYHVLNELVEWGEIRRFDPGDGQMHFDADTSCHTELVCMRCYTVIDAPVEESHPLKTLPEELAGYRIITRSEQYFGFCPACRRKIEQTTARS